jgi:hypothetical protein
MNLFQSKGILRYSKTENAGYKLVVEIDPAISKFYRSLIPKYIKIQPQKYAPHISVVRKSYELDLSCWMSREGFAVSFFYCNVIRNCERYYWIDVFSIELEEIRKELGLPLHSRFIDPPKEYIHCFHITLGNIK